MLFEQPLDARVAAEDYDADTVARVTAILEQPDDLERAAPALGRHGPRDVHNDHDVDALTANRRDRHGRQEREENQDSDSDGPAQAGPDTSYPAKAGPHAAYPAEAELHIDVEEKQRND